MKMHCAMLILLFKSRIIPHKYNVTHPHMNHLGHWPCLCFWRNNSYWEWGVEIVSSCCSWGVMWGTKNPNTNYTLFAMKSEQFWLPIPIPVVNNFRSSYNILLLVLLLALYGSKYWIFICLLDTKCICFFI